MSKTSDVQAQMTLALKAHDAPRKEALSLLLSALKAKAKDKRADLTPEEEDAIIAREIKQTKETMQSAPENRQDIIEECRFRLQVLSEFAPKEMSAEEIRAAVRRTLDSLSIPAPTPKDKGAIMKALMPLVKGRADGKLVNEIVSEFFQ